VLYDYYMTKVVGCRVSNEIYEKIQNLDVAQSDFFRNLIKNYFFKTLYNDLRFPNQLKQSHKLQFHRYIHGIDNQ